MKKLNYAMMTTLLLGSAAVAAGFGTDTLKTRDGGALTITFFGHASLGFGFETPQGERDLYVDPVSEHADYGKLPKADVILITHEHSDHFDPVAIAALTKTGTVIVCNPNVGKLLEGKEPGGAEVVMMRNGDRLDPVPWLGLEAVAAYNTTPGRDRFHPRGRDNGYVMTIGGDRIYVAGDTEPTPEMAVLKDIDVAFLPVNQPYTMTVDQAVYAARTLKPEILYPYHYGTGEMVTPVDEIVRELADQAGTEVRIRKMK